VGRQCPAMNGRTICGRERLLCSEAPFASRFGSDGCRRQRTFIAKTLDSPLLLRSSRSSATASKTARERPLSEAANRSSDPKRAKRASAFCHAPHAALQALTHSVWPLQPRWPASHASRRGLRSRVTSSFLL
jgi:hypothetical protein